MEYPVYVSFRCDSDLDRQVRIEAARRDLNRTEFIIAALREKLERIKNAQSTQDTAKSHA